MDILWKWISDNAGPLSVAIIALSAVFTLILVFRRRRTKTESQVPNRNQDRDEWEVHLALYWIVDYSAWMRWQDAQQLAHNGKLLEEMSKMHLAEARFRHHAERNVITVRGRRRGQLDYEDISPDVWKSTYLDVQRDKITLWRATMKARDGLDQEATKQIPDYVSLQVSEKTMLEKWPKKEKKLDGLTKKLLKEAKRRGITLLLI